MNPDRLAELEEERGFLLRSIRDIESEHAAGDVDVDDFRTLRDGYVARAAAVLREIDDGQSSRMAKPDRPRWQRPLIIGGTLAVAVALGLFVANSAGQRLPGQSLTGGQPADEVAVRLADGRRLMNTDITASLAAYARVLEIEPTNPEARTYTGWLIVLNGNQAQSQEQVQQGVDLLHEAVTFDATYADPHCLLAVAGANFFDPPDVEMVRSEGAVCLSLNPPADMVPLVQGLLDRVAATETTSSSG